ncbi:lysophospholipid acyltransferase family protein [Desulfotignum balticum]|uniref:lysophospholipid acyltransferase family protein n=1 Tax=Desulfotignum balticum TaxID=115781 RepID=UPI0004083364|nr:lysophospholipid acyltransferase family protein [Desulfotignum balticum]
MNRILKWMYQPYKWVIVMPFMVIITLVLGMICIVVGAFFSRDATNALAVIWSRLACGIVPVKVKLSGKKNCQQQHAYVVVANHQSMVDIPVIHGFMGLHIKWVMKQELRKIPVFGTACHYLGCIFIDRSRHDAAIQSIRQAKKRMSVKASVLFFAEGTRSRDGQVQPFKKGAFVFARETGLPVLPVTIKHSREVLPPDSLNLIPGPVEIIVHRPVYVLPGDAGRLAATIEAVRTTIAGPLNG